MHKHLVEHQNSFGNKVLHPSDMGIILTLIVLGSLTGTDKEGG